MGAAESAFQGRFSFRMVPYWAWFLNRWSEPDVKKGVSQKSAQAAWTQSVICNALGHNVHVRRSTCIAMFPKTDFARSFDQEKFTPMVESTPVLGDVLPVQSRSKKNKTLYKSFPGGFIKFVGSNSISDLKGTSAKLLIIEEPDDCNVNLKGQGDSIKLLEERGKSYRDRKVLVGGTPSIKGVSSIEDEMLQSDQNRWMVPCPDCGEFQALEWEQVRWQTEGAEVEHPMYGYHRTDTAVYVCSSCGSCWDDSKKNLAVQRGHAEPQAPFRGVLGLYINELYAPWHESRMQVLVERYLAAKYEEEKGNIEALIVFHNACLGRAWEHKGQTATKDDLAERGLSYAAGTVPAGGLVITMGVDVQHNRLAVIMRAWGRGEESWLVMFDELEGNAVDKNDAVWAELDKLVFGNYKHAWGPYLRVRAVTIDAGDGTASDAVYHWVRSRKNRGVEIMAGKGASIGDPEIFRRPTASIDSSKNNTKAARHGLRPYIIGVNRAKDLILGDKGPGRLSLEGNGAGRIHWYSDVRADYLEQFTSEVKVPVRGARGKRVWQVKKGIRNEVLDAEIYALHASRAVKVHLAREQQWQALEAQIRQHGLFQPAPQPLVLEAGATAAPPDETPQAPPETPAPIAAKPAPAPRPRRPNWVQSFRN